MSVAISSCEKENSSIVVTQDIIQGVWTHNYNIEPDLTMPPEFKQIKFVQDSFYMIYRWNSEYLTSECPYSTGIWYLKGKYKLIDSKIYFNGDFTDENYNNNTDSSGCLQVGNWTDSFRTNMNNNKVLNFYWLVPISSMPESHKNIELIRQ